MVLLEEEVSDAPYANDTCPGSAAPGTIEVSISNSGGTGSAPLAVMRPRITSVDPASVVAGTSSIVLTVSGTAFLPTSQIVFLGGARTTTFDPATGSLSTTLSGSDLSLSGSAAVLLQNSSEAVSAPFLLNIAPAGQPRIDALDRSTIVTGGTSAVMNVFGMNFLRGAIVRVNGIAKLTELISSNQLRMTLDTDDLAVARSLMITVTNPDGLTSDAATVVVSAAPPPPPGPRRRAVRP